MPKETKPSWGASLVVFCVGLLVIIICFAKCENKKEPAASAPASVSEASYLDSLYDSPRASSGQTRRITEECLAANSKDAFKEMNRICNRKDEAALYQMIADGRVRVIPANTEVEWLGYSLGVNEVRLEDRTWFVSQEFVSK